VASSGTSLTVDQIRLIKRITPNITMLYDGDAAGIKAALRGTDLILEEGMNVRIVILPDAEDPDSYVKKVGSDAFAEFIKHNRKDLILFKTSLFAAEAKNDPIKKSELIRDIIDSIGKIPDSIHRSVYIKECSQLFEMDEQILITEVNKLRRKKARDEQSSIQKQDEQHTKDSKQDQLPDSFHQEQFNEATSNLHILERDIIRILIEFGSWKVDEETEANTVAAYMLDDLDGIDIETARFKPVYELIKREFAQGNIHDEKFFTANEDEQITSLAIELLTQPYSVSENWWEKYKIVIPDKKSVFIKDIQSACIRLKQFKNISELKKIEQRIKDVKDETELVKLMKLHKLLIEQKKEFAKTVGNVIYRPTM
jgi:DNA primase